MDLYLHGYQGMHSRVIRVNIHAQIYICTYLKLNVFLSLCTSETPLWSCIVLISLKKSSKIAVQTKIAQRPQFTGNQPNLVLN